MVEVDGEIFTFSGSTDWELAEMCITPSSSSIDIIVDGEPVDVFQTFIMLDDAECSFVAGCCPLVLEIPEDDLEVCALEDLQIEIDLMFSSAPITYDWVSDPSDGADYLLDDSVEDPIFNYQPVTLPFDGAQYVFTVTVEDDNCLREEELMITVFPAPLPHFDFETDDFCENEGTLIFPLISNEGITGTWAVSSVDLSVYGADEFCNTFTPDGVSGHCPIPSEHCLDVDLLTIPSFDFPLIFCPGDTDAFVFPDESIESVFGEWTPASINLENLVPDDYDISFVSDEFCTEDVELEIEILKAELIEFTLPDTICTSQLDTLFFPIESDNGVDGFWDVPFLVKDSSFVMFNTFHSTSEDCYYDFEYQLVVVDAIATTFDIIDTLCRDAGLVTLNNISLEGIAGQWSIPSFNTNTIVGNVLMTTWLPDNPYACYASQTIEIVIEEVVSASFDLPESFCVMDSLLVLPQISAEGYVGAWSVPVIDLSITGEVNSTFIISDVQCTLEYTWSASVESQTSIEFVLPDELCVSSSILIMPPISDNGIEGTWNISQVDPFFNVDQEVSLFFVANDRSLCVDTFYHTIQVSDLIEPEFDLPESVCEDTPDFTLESTSLNGVTGTWQPATISPSQFIDSLRVEFFPDDNCYAIASFTIIKPPINDFQFETRAADCITNLGEFIFESDGRNLEYSLDQGITWMNESIPASVSTGTYDFLVRDPDFPDCLLEEGPFTIANPDAPEIEEIVVVPLSNCMNDNASIEINAIGTNLEYSIDGGINWQADNLFNQLIAGTYNIAVANTDMCLVTDLVIIDPQETVVIDSIVLNDVSECLRANGEIIVITSNSNIEYSIDGMNWQSNSAFLDLGEGNYTIIIRDSLETMCLDSLSASLLAPELVVIQQVEETDPSDCKVADGMIVITYGARDVEVSIDNGITWTTIINDMQASFIDLLAGTYDIIVRDSRNISCADSAQVKLVDPAAIAFEDVTIVNSSDCFPESGNLSITPSGFEYSIDGGLTWSDEAVTSGLIAGPYSLSMRDPNALACEVDTMVVITQEPEDGPMLDFQLTAPSICLGNDGSVIFDTVLGDYEFSIDDGVDWQIDLSFMNLAAGQFTVLIRKVNAPDCSSALDFVLIDPPCPCGDLDLMFEITDIYCKEESVGQISLIDIQGFNTDYSLSWSTGETTESILGLDEGWYYLTVSYDEDCTWIDSQWVTRYDPLDFILTTYDTECDSVSNGSIEVSNVQGGVGVYDFSLGDMSFQSNNSFSNLSAGDYEIFVLDSLGCLESQAAELGVLDSIDILLPDSISIELGDTLILNPLINEESIDSFVWSPQLYIADTNQLIAEVIPEESISYMLTVYFGNCTDTRTINIEVIQPLVPVEDPPTDIYIANTFNPAGNSNNKIFLQASGNLDLDLQTFSIYDRWGNKVFDKILPTLNDPSDGWDGSFNGSQAQQGVYVFFLKYMDMNGQEQVETGTITLIR